MFIDCLSYVVKNTNRKINEHLLWFMFSSLHLTDNISKIFKPLIFCWNHMSCFWWQLLNIDQYFKIIIMTYIIKAKLGNITYDLKAYYQLSILLDFKPFDAGSIVIWRLLNFNKILNQSVLDQHWKPRSIRRPFLLNIGLLSSACIWKRKSKI